MEKRLSGTCKFYNDEKQYGFISAENGKDYFFHKTGLTNETKPMKGDRVMFKIITAPRGPKAVEVFVV